MKKGEVIRVKGEMKAEGCPPTSVLSPPSSWIFFFVSFVRVCGKIVNIMNKLQINWLPGYIKSIRRRPKLSGGLKHLVFCVVDHFEPFGYPQAREKNMQRLDRWLEDYPLSVQGLTDSYGNPVRHSLFCAAEDYAPDYMNKIQAFCEAGYGEVEVHLHHRNDTPDGVREKLETFRDQLHGSHGMLGTDKDGKPRYGFVHGNWALCNSRHDGDWCGVNEELSILKDTGCYADFTFPSAPDSSQPNLVNAIYRAKDNSEGRGADSGELVTVGGDVDDDSLMIITGPLALNWQSRKWGLLPRIENADISRAHLPSVSRAGLWVEQNISVVGREEWVFVKLHTHGMVPYNSRVLFGDAMREMYEQLQSEYNDGENWALHYMTAREMYNVVRAAEAGEIGLPGEYRDYEIQRPSYVSTD